MVSILDRASLSADPLDVDHVISSLPCADSVMDSWIIAGIWQTLL